MDYLNKLRMAFSGSQTPQGHSGDREKVLRYPSSTWVPKHGNPLSFATHPNLERHLISRHTTPKDVEKHSLRKGNTAERKPFRRWAKQLAEVKDGDISKDCATMFGISICTLPNLAILNGFARGRDRLRMAEDHPSTEPHGLSMSRMMGKLELLLPKPHPGILMTTIVVLGASVSMMYQLNRDDEFQDKILAAGITLAFIVGTILGHDAETIILGVLPWAILLALSLSAVGHRICRHVTSNPNSCEADLSIWTYA